MTGPRTVRFTTAAAGLAICVTGCSSGSSHPVTRPKQPHPAAVKTVVRDFPMHRAGQAGVVTSPGQHASLRIAVNTPRVSTRSRSAGYGYPPRYGRYVTFRLTVRNTGKVPVTVRRLDFWVRTPGVAKTTTDAGNAPYSGGGRQFDSTVVVPGQQVRNDLTFDVAHPTGTLFYGPGGHRAIGWTF